MLYSSTPVDLGRPAVRARRHPAHEGLRAGLLGATVVWLWLFVNDWLSGSPLHTAALLGRGLLSLGGAGTPAAPTWAGVLAFTVVHVALWAGLAALALVAVHTAARTPTVLLLAAVVFILLQLASVGVDAILAQGRVGALAWRGVFAGNIAAWAATLWYIARRHPELRVELAHVDDDA